MPSHRDEIFADQTVRNPSTRLQDLLAQLSSYRVYVVIYIVEDCKFSLVMILQEYKIGYRAIT